MNETQFKTIFLGTFGKTLEELGFALDTSGLAPVAKKDTHILSLFVVDGRLIEWRHNDTSLIPYTFNGRDDRGMARKADALEKLTAAIS